MKKISYFVSIVFAVLLLVLGCPALVIAQDITEDSGTVTSGALASAAGDTGISLFSLETYTDSYGAQSGWGCQAAL